MPTTQLTPKLTRVSIRRAVETLLETGARKATVFQHPLLTVVATRRHKPHKGYTRQVEILLTVGRPNARNRKLVKDYQEALMSFPIRRVRLVWWSKAKK